MTGQPRNFRVFSPQFSESECKPFILFGMTFELLRCYAMLLNTRQAVSTGLDGARMTGVEQALWSQDDWGRAGSLEPG